MAGVMYTNKIVDEVCYFKLLPPEIELKYMTVDPHAWVA